MSALTSASFNIGFTRPTVSLLHITNLSPHLSSSDQVRNSYFIGLDGSLRLVLANGMEVSLHTEPHLLAGTIIPTVSKRNVTLAIDNGLNLVEWRQRKEQARGQVTVYGRRLRVSSAALLKVACA